MAGSSVDWTQRGCSSTRGACSPPRELAASPRAGRVASLQLGLDFEGGAVDPGAGEGGGEDVGGGVFAVDGDVCVVGVAAAGEGDVDAAGVGGSVEVEDGVVDGAALVGVAGLGVAELDIVGHVAGGQLDGSCDPGGGDAAVGVDGGDGPVVAVADHVVLVGAKAAVVSAGDDLVALMQHVGAACEDGAVGVESACVEESSLGVLVEFFDGVVGSGP